MLPNPWPWHRPSLALWPRLIPVAWPPGCLGALRAATEARAKYLCILQAHVSPVLLLLNVYLLQLPLLRPVVAADGGDWHHVVSCPASWVPHWGWRGRGLPGPTLLFPLKCPPLQPASSCPLCSSCPTCQLSTAPSALHSAKGSQHCQGGCRAGKKAWDQLLHPPPILPPSSDLPPAAQTILA